jgi:hypothetical protein
MKTKSTVIDTVPTARMKKAESSRKNGHKSPGPKTLRGKNYSCRNSLKHGFYSKELLVSDADAPEFQEMCSALEGEAKPETKFQELAFDHVVACFWRTKIAARLEGRQFARQLEDVQHGHSQGETPDPAAGFERWYVSSWEDMCAGIRALEGAMAEFAHHGSFREETKKSLTRSFGAEFLGVLEEWTSPMKLDAILLAENLIKHREIFGDGPNPRFDLSSEAKRVVVDPKQGRHMVVKLLEQRRTFLKELLIIRKRNTLDGMRDARQGSEFNPHLVRDAQRELQRAKDGYWSLRANGH